MEEKVASNMGQRSAQKLNLVEKLKNEMNSPELGPKFGRKLNFMNNNTESDEEGISLFGRSQKNAQKRDDSISIEREFTSPSDFMNK